MIVRSSEVLGMYGDGCFDSQGRIVRAWTDAPGTEPNLVIDREDAANTFSKLFHPRLHPPDGLGLQRIAMSPRDVICIAGQSQSGSDDAVVWLSTRGFLPNMGHCATRPIVRWDGDAFDLAVPFNGTQHARWRISEDGLSVSSTTGSHVMTSSGSSHFDAAGQPVVYPEHGSEINGRWFGFPCASHDVVVGQGRGAPAEPGLLLAVDGLVTTLDRRDPAMEPHVSGDSAECLVVARMGEQFGPILFAVCQPPYVADPVYVPPAEVIPVPQPGEIAPLRPLWIGAYKDAGRTLGGNCEFGPTGWLVRRRDAMPIAKLGADSTIWMTPIGETWMGIYAYLPPPGPATVAEARAALKVYCEEKLMQVPQGTPVVLLCQMYDRRTNRENNGWTREAPLVGLLAVYPEVARAHPQIVALLFFSGPDRLGGTGQHPAMIPWYEAIAAAVEGEPAIDLPPAPGPEPIPEPQPDPIPPVVVPPPVVEPPPAPIPRPAPKKGWVEKYFGWET
jgi:hypothetical protein